MIIKFQPTKMNAKFEFSLFSYFFLVFIIYQIPSKMEPYIRLGNPVQFKIFFDMAILPLCFILVNLQFYFILKKHLVMRTVIMLISGIIMAIIKFIQAPGIIDPVYFFILAATCSVILGVYKGAYFDEQLKRVNKYNEVTIKLIEYIRDSYKYLLGKAFQGWLGLGASLGVSMSILFKNGYQDLHLKFLALKMLIGFICITVAVGFWVAIPMINGIVTVHESLYSLEEKNDSTDVTRNIQKPSNGLDRSF